MKPPICCICNKDLKPGEGGLIYFKKRKSDIQWEKRMKKIKGVGHPPYAEWFCNMHYKCAKEISHLTIDQAIRKVKENGSTI